MAASPALLPAGPLPTPHSSESSQASLGLRPGVRPCQWERRGGGNTVTGSPPNHRRLPKFGTDFYSAHDATRGPGTQLCALQSCSTFLFTV